MLDREEYTAMKERMVCSCCIEENYLKKVIEQDGESSQCYYCGVSGSCISIVELSEHIDTVFCEYYQKTDDDMSEDDYYRAKYEPGYIFQRDGQDVVEIIEELIEVKNDDIVSDVHKILEYGNYDMESAKIGIETEYATDSMYEYIGINKIELDIQWAEMNDSLIADNRYFNPQVKDLFAFLFDNLNELQNEIGKDFLVSAGPDTDFSTVFRARCFQSQENMLEALKHPDISLGPPPGKCARAGRMNPSGISVFYGAKKPAVALAEVRPPVGSQVVVAEFTIVKPVTLLDLGGIDPDKMSGSMFDPKYSDLKKRLLFLKELGMRIAKPVMPDHEEFGYLITQLISDYLSTKTGQKVDGILFPSVQASSREEYNLVLFHRSSRVESIKLPNGCEIWSGSFCGPDGETPEYKVFVTIPKDSESTKDDNCYPTSIDRDVREPYLRIKADSLEIHDIESVVYTDSTHQVERTIYEKPEKPLPLPSMAELLEP